MTDERLRFLNEDLVLKVSGAFDRAVWDESRYEAFLDELCGTREYQKDAIRTAMRYLRSGRYRNARDLARENFDSNATLRDRYGTWVNMERQLQFPDQLSASIDLATGTGKSYVLYGMATILLSEGVVDVALVLCPSLTIESELLEKFRLLAGDDNLRSLLPDDAVISSPHIIQANETITEGSICVENYHAVLERTGSSIRDSLCGRGHRVAVLNDEAHHTANEPAAAVSRWKEFLSDPDFGFLYVLGVSGTCYVGDDYFTDVISRYSLRNAIEDRFVKTIEYVAEMPQSREPDEAWQVVVHRHEQIRSHLEPRGILPLTIVVTPNIRRCVEVASELKEFLIRSGKVLAEDVDSEVLTIYSGAPDVRHLRHLDALSSRVQWVVSVSMLNEGWDVKRVFQIVPHEERAFNSKLLISQVLGRGLRIPEGWQGPQPVVTVFNHEAWASRIEHLVNEVLELESRLSSRVVAESPYHFNLHNIDYTLDATSVTTPMTSDYILFEKGYVDLAVDYAEREVAVDLVNASTGVRSTWRTSVNQATYSPEEITREMHQRLVDADGDASCAASSYSETYSETVLQGVVSSSLARIGVTRITDTMRQRFLASLGTLRRGATHSVRYAPVENRFFEMHTRERQAESVSAAELRSTKTIFITEDTRAHIPDEQLAFFDEATEPGSHYSAVPVPNALDMKAPLSLVIADSANERRFVLGLTDPRNAAVILAWIKNTHVRFYEIDYAWRKGEHPKRGKFSPDFLIKTEELIVVVEIKDDAEIDDPSPENVKKNEYARAHFRRVNAHLAASGQSVEYKFAFLTPRDYQAFFQALRDGAARPYRSNLDVALSGE